MTTDDHQTHIGKATTRITLCLALVLVAATSACSSSESEDLYGA